MKRRVLVLLIVLSWPALCVGRVFAAPSLTVFFTANTYGAFSPCPT
ncbi:hypothetical protein [Desulfolutivibrio sulfoxidireducens]|nr:hypothetical protein [Desulfolutivibrio sulfoxidireducens]